MLLVNLESGQSNSHLLQMAAWFQASVIGVTARMPIQLSSGDGYIDGEVFEQDRKEIDKAIVEARTAFRDAMGTRTRDLDWRWMVTFGPLVDDLAAEARRADLILTAAPSKNLPNRARQINLGGCAGTGRRDPLPAWNVPAIGILPALIVKWSLRCMQWF